MRNLGDTVTTTEPPPIAALIRERREQAGLTKRQAAITAGLSPTYWANIERGTSHPSPDAVAKAAAALWITPEELEACGEQAAAAELERRLDAGPEIVIRDEVRALAEKIAQAHHLSERSKREIAKRIMDIIPGQDNV